MTDVNHLEDIRKDYIGSGEKGVECSKQRICDQGIKRQVLEVNCEREEGDDN